MIFIHIRHYSDYGSFQRVFDVMEVFIDFSLNNAPHVVIQWIKSGEDEGQMLGVTWSWKFSTIYSCVIWVLYDSADSFVVYWTQVSTILL